MNWVVVTLCDRSEPKVMHQEEDQEEEGYVGNQKTNKVEKS